MLIDDVLEMSIEEDETDGLCLQEDEKKRKKKQKNKNL